MSMSMMQVRTSIGIAMRLPVAGDLVDYSTLSYFGISTGLEGWLLKQLHPGMSPVNTVVETLQQVCFACPGNRYLLRAQLGQPGED